MHVLIFCDIFSLSLSKSKNTFGNKSSYLIVLLNIVHYANYFRYKTYVSITNISLCILYFGFNFYYSLDMRVKMILGLKTFIGSKVILLVMFSTTSIVY